MKFLCGPSAVIAGAAEDVRPIALFERSSGGEISAGAAVGDVIRRRRLVPTVEAWDFLAIALAVVVVDGEAQRSASPDGWTRQLELEIALKEPDTWRPHAQRLEQALAFLTTDRWALRFREGGAHPAPSRLRERLLEAESIALLSGGLDSLIGALDLAAGENSFVAVSQTVRGDGDKQQRFADLTGAAAHVQLNHNANTARSQKETSQRSRSLIFLAFAALIAATLEPHRGGQVCPIFLSENGFIAINPALTSGRVGSLSTRTAHPHFLGLIQSVLDGVGLRVSITNRYLTKTKGEMLLACADQRTLTELAVESTSCGRFQRYNYVHCGRCIPCQIRRASFLKAGFDDTTEYFFDDLSKDDEDHARYDDVRSVAIARLSAEANFDRWLGPSLSSPYINDAHSLRSMLKRGMSELADLHSAFGLT
jgi:hypothetical protein